MPATVIRIPLAMSPDALTATIRTRPPRAEAKREITETVVPMRTCYETMIRLVGPIAAVLDYASYLFSEEAAAPVHPTPPLSIDEAHLVDNGRSISLVLSRGSFTIR